MRDRGGVLASCRRPTRGWVRSGWVGGALVGALGGGAGMYSFRALSRRPDQACHTHRRCRCSHPRSHPHTHPHSSSPITAAGSGHCRQRRLPTRAARGGRQGGGGLPGRARHDDGGRRRRADAAVLAAHQLRGPAHAAAELRRGAAAAAAAGGAGRPGVRWAAHWPGVQPGKRAADGQQPAEPATCTNT